MQIGDFDIKLNHFLRYVYGGFILCLITILILPQQSTELYFILGGKELQGNVFLIFLFVAIGTALYAFYKVIISEFIIDWIHFNKPWFLWKHVNEDCVFQYLVGLGVDKRHRLVAFRIIRDKHFSDEARKIFYLRHSETHALYITSTACFIGLLFRLGAWAFEVPVSNALVWISILIVGFVSFFAGLFSDKNLCTDECNYCRLIEEDIKGTLTKAKLSK